jgi:hypothetical protein
MKQAPATETEFALADECCHLADDHRELYHYALAYFGRLCAALRKPDGVHRIQVVSHLPSDIFGDRQALGWFITGALMALMAQIVSVEQSRRLLEIEPSTLLLQPPEPLATFDSVILVQARTLGTGILTSDPVMMRVLFWQQRSPPMTEKWLRALRQAGRIFSARNAAPLDEPGLRQAKQDILAELTPVVERLRRKFSTQRRQIAKRKDVAVAFQQEVNDPEFPYLHERVEEWACFIQNSKANAELFYFRTFPVTRIFDRFLAWKTGRSEDYVRQCLARRPK